MSDGEGQSRILLIWMHSDRYPAWRIPDEVVEQLAEDGAGEWEVRAIRVAADAVGDRYRVLIMALAWVAVGLAGWRLLESERADRVVIAAGANL